jgi:hypothetical protein
VQSPNAPRLHRLLRRCATTRPVVLLCAPVADDPRFDTPCRVLVGVCDHRGRAVALGDQRVRAVLELELALAQASDAGFNLTS